MNHDIVLCTPETDNSEAICPVPANLKEFKAFVLDNAAIKDKIADLKTRVESFSKGFSMPGYDDH